MPLSLWAVFEHVFAFWHPKMLQAQHVHFPPRPRNSQFSKMPRFLLLESGLRNQGQALGALCAVLGSLRKCSGPRSSVSEAAHDRPAGSDLPGTTGLVPALLTRSACTAPSEYFSRDRQHFQPEYRVQVQFLLPVDLAFLVKMFSPRVISAGFSPHSFQ